MIPFIPPRPGNPAPPAPELPWPNGARCAVMPSFDVDAESAWLSYDAANADRLVTLSYGGYEARVGVPKILDYLRAIGLRATFFIPGWVVEAHPAMCEAILRDGHEIGHPGYLHKRPDPADLAHDIEEVDRGLEALKRVLGVVPRGYRSPAGETSDTTVRLLTEHGFLYDSSMMGDVNPTACRGRTAPPA